MTRRRLLSLRGEITMMFKSVFFTIYIILLVLSLLQLAIKQNKIYWITVMFNNIFVIYLLYILD